METPEDATEQKLDKVDSYLTKFGIILKKHWGKLLLILFGYCVYWAFTQPASTPEKAVQPAADSVVYYDSDTVSE